jgi:negative regulator of flagellin synthesis FlgM
MTGLQVSSGHLPVHLPEKEVGMKIHGNKPPENQDVSNLNTQKVSRATGKEKAAPAAKTGTTDRVEISEKGREIAEMRAAVNQLPDIRTDKVNTVKEAIDAGNYKVDPLKIAEKMLKGI